MSIHATYTTARANFATLWDKVTENHRVVIINRRGSEDVAFDQVLVQRDVTQG